MPRTKMTRKKSSIVKKNKSILPKPSVSLLRDRSPASSVGSSASEFADDWKMLLSNTYESPEHIKRAIEAYYEKKIEAKIHIYNDCVAKTKDVISNLMKIYPEKYLNSCINEQLDETVLREFNFEPKIRETQPGRSRLNSNAEQPTEFKKPRTPRRTSRKRSLSAPGSSAPPIFKPCWLDCAQTPLNNNRQQMAQIKSITPKVSDTPMSVMRRPQHGEVAFSTSGSPLLIGSVSREDIPTVNVPLQDGRVFSILPDPGLPPPDLPQFDDETKQYLKTLRQHLAMLSNTP